MKPSESAIWKGIIAVYAGAQESSQHSVLASTLRISFGLTGVTTALPDLCKKTIASGHSCAGSQKLLSISGVRNEIGTSPFIPQDVLV